jgi:hypothetical protein
MSGQAMLYIARRRTDQASVAAFSPHDLRRTFISDLIIAYEQPVTRADIRNIRSVDSDAVVETLRAADWSPRTLALAAAGGPAFSSPRRRSCNTSG